MIVDTRTGAVVSMTPEEQKIYTAWLLTKMEENENFLDEI